MEKDTSLENQQVPTALLREKIRNYAREQREKVRANATDKYRFGLGEIKAKIAELDQLNEKDVAGLAARIKRRKHATTEDMYRLSHAFLQHIENIRAFAKIPGAIQVLVKELTGNDAERQVCAAECLCNLSLGETPVCEKIASMAGSYLVTYLDSTEELLKRTALWTLANILATGDKGAQTLIQMKLVPKLWQLYADDICALDASSDFRAEAAICLHLITTHADTLLSNEDRQYLAQNFHSKNVTCIGGEYLLQIVFDCETVQPHVELPTTQLLFLINCAMSNLSNATDISDNTTHLRVSYAVRVLANLMATQEHAYTLLLEQLASIWQTNVTQFFNKLFAFNVAVLTHETLWLLQTVLQQQSETDAKLVPNLLQNLKVPPVEFD